MGQIVEGKISGIKDYGLFVDLGESKSGMVHISEVSKTYVNDINELYKIGDSVKMKILNISDDGKISLSIKKAAENEQAGRTQKGEDRRDNNFKHTKPDGSYTWTPKKEEPSSFEEMMNRFKQTSDEKFSDLKRKNPDSRRSKRGASK